MRSYMNDHVRSAIVKIRKLVPRPKDLPDCVGFIGPLRFTAQSRAPEWPALWQPLIRCVCPLGMMKGSKSPSPMRDVPGFSDVEVRQFAIWWDSLKDAKRAVKRVWG
jgi:hypothetical protein